FHRRRNAGKPGPAQHIHNTRDDNPRSTRVPASARARRPNARRTASSDGGAKQNCPGAPGRSTAFACKSANVFEDGLARQSVRLPRDQHADCCDAESCEASGADASTCWLLRIALDVRALCGVLAVVAPARLALPFSLAGRRLCGADRQLRTDSAGPECWRACRRAMRIWIRDRTDLLL